MKKFLSLICLLGLTSPVLAQGTFEQHEDLVRRVNQTEITVKLNDEDCLETMAFGWYSAYDKEIVICQEGMEEVGVQVGWTDEDLDTLRHEVHHYVQDCMTGGLTDGELDVVYESPMNLATDVLGLDGVSYLIQRYRENDADDQRVILELEAFAVATLSDPVEQIKDIDTYCVIE